MALSTVLKLHPSCQCNLSMLLGKFESKCQLIHWEKFISISYSIASEATSYCKRTWNAEKDEELTSCCPVPSSYYYPITQSKVIKLFGLRTHGKGSRRWLALAADKFTSLFWPSNLQSDLLQQDFSPLCFLACPQNSAGKQICLHKHTTMRTSWYRESKR